jgi:hypothetical protein
VNDIWVCNDCKSINRQRDAHCYRCRAPRTGAMETPGLDLRATNAAVERSVRSYVISWPLALITVVLLIADAILGVWILRLRASDFPALRDAFLQAVASGRQPDTALVTSSVQIGLVSLISTGLSLLAILTLAGWMALVTRNVPLLGGGTPSRSPMRVFIYTLIPIFNLYKVPGMIQDLLYRVDPQEGGAFMVIAATIGLVGSRFVSWIGSWMITVAAIRALVPQIEAGDTSGMTKTFGDVLDQGFWLDAVVAVMVVIGTLLLAAIMIRIESRCSARDREIRSQMAVSGAPVAPEGPAWGQAPQATAAPAPVPAAAPVPVQPAPPASPSPQPYEPAYPAGRPWPGSSSTSVPPASPAASAPPPPPSAPDPNGPPPPPPGASTPG